MSFHIQRPAEDVIRATFSAIPYTRYRTLKRVRPWQCDLLKGPKGVQSATWFPPPDSLNSPGPSRSQREGFLLGSVPSHFDWQYVINLALVSSEPAASCRGDGACANGVLDLPARAKSRYREVPGETCAECADNSDRATCSDWNWPPLYFLSLVASSGEACPRYVLRFFGAILK